ncbi:MAG TPA: hypothetical protein VLU46_13630 [Thermoanaerobaculia bacterium]|nr:hypothetical protein [Thermoanaerobaculia bacterium]
MKLTTAVRPRKLAVTEINLRKTAMRVLGQRLVSPEIQYIQRTLGTSTTQEEMDKSVLGVRKMPWSTVMSEQ